MSHNNANDSFNQNPWQGVFGQKQTIESRGHIRIIRHINVEDE